MSYKEGDSMRIGFIGAGKMGFTLGKHLSEYVSASGKGLPEHEIHLMGYYSKNILDAKEAAEFTDTKYYEDLDNLVKESDTLFVMVPDEQIAVIVKELNRLGQSMEQKIICHTSGALSSRVFSGMDSQVYGYSVHPIYAVNSKTESYINFGDCFITIEGHDKYLDQMVKMFEDIGHKVKVISPHGKAKYHSAAVFASNLVIALCHMGEGLLKQCGFSEDEAHNALKPLIRNNLINMYECQDYGDALTGPVVRNDIETVRKHIETLNGNELSVYKILSDELIRIADNKTENNFDCLRELLNDKS